jgi:hypothetical protein
MFLDKGESTRKRLITEWSNALIDSTKIPVLTIEQIVSKYHFGPKQALKTLVCALLTAASVYTVFRFHVPILSFFARPELKWRLVSTAAIAAFVPFFAYVYSTVTSSVLKLLKFD